jgi:hypothetical protein
MEAEDSAHAEGWAPCESGALARDACKMALEPGRVAPDDLLTR